MKLKPTAVFSDRMILQREKPAAVFGAAEPGAEICVEIQGVHGSGTADADGRWLVQLPALQTSVCETMVIRSGEEKVVIHDVMVGEVWLAGGQSNMEFQMRYDRDFEAEQKICDNPMVRIFDVPKIFVSELAERYDFSQFGFWRTADAEDLQYFSAVGYYFAQALSAQLQVPIGIVGCNVGGTRTCCWVDEETVEACGPQWVREYEEGLRSVPDLETAKERYLNGMVTNPAKPFENSVYRELSVEELKASFQKMADAPMSQVIGPWHEWRPCGMYHQMLETVIPYTMRGVVWYQGESDETHPECYTEMMKGLIGLWRRKWGEELSFLLTQLAPLGQELGPGGSGYPEIRRQQEALTELLPGVWTASTSDCGHSYDIHPKAKRPVGTRLALLALAHVYGRPILAEAPVPESVRREDGKIRIDFRNADGGLMLRGDTVKALQVFDGERELTAGTEIRARVDGRSVWIEAVGNADVRANRVAFARQPYYQVNLYNMAMVPAKPFEAAVG